MTSKLKCPYCSADLESTTGGWEYGCTNTECQSAGTLCGTTELWQALIQAKQDLEIAKNGLRRVITKTNSQVVRGFEYIATGIVKVAKDTLKQIEHKE